MGYDLTGPELMMAELSHCLSICSIHLTWRVLHNRLLATKKSRIGLGMHTKRFKTALERADCGDLSFHRMEVFLWTEMQMGIKTSAMVPTSQKYNPPM